MHELNEKEWKVLIEPIDQSLPENTNTIEKNKWTIWKAVNGLF
ncbi:hypothetical protein [Virgibacillus alimentarius]|nr:hypothetical protein [Virgibacillus alimentarius]